MVKRVTVANFNRVLSRFIHLFIFTLYVTIPFPTLYTLSGTLSRQSSEVIVIVRAGTTT